MSQSMMTAMQHVVVIQVNYVGPTSASSTISSRTRYFAPLKRCNFKRFIS